MSVLFSSFGGPYPDPNPKTAKKYNHGPKIITTEILKIHKAFTLTKNVEIGPFIKASIQI
jgi:hypothetical protein